MAALVQGRLVSFGLHKHCFDQSLLGLAHHQLAQQALGELNDVLPEVVPVQFMLILDILGREVGRS